MTTPAIETFEKNIADEIRHKEASITDIAAATEDVKKQAVAEEKSEKHTTRLFVIVGVLILCAVIGILVAGYLYAIGKFDPFKPSAAELSIEKEKQLKPPVTLASISPTLDYSIGRYVSRVQKDSTGVVVELSSYQPVFAYMLKNENDFADELAKAVSVARDTKGIKRDIVNTSTTTLASSTNSGGTTTIVSVSTSTEVYFAPPLVFSDVTISNQNMRTAASDKSTVVYAFLGTRALLIASSTEGVLALRARVLNSKK
jgi:hypothetical protein